MVTRIRELAKGTIWGVDGKIPKNSLMVHYREVSRHLTTGAVIPANKRLILLGIYTGVVRGWTGTPLWGQYLMYHKKAWPSEGESPAPQLRSLNSMGPNYLVWLPKRERWLCLACLCRMQLKGADYKVPKTHKAVTCRTALTDDNFMFPLELLPKADRARGSVRRVSTRTRARVSTRPWAGL